MMVLKVIYPGATFIELSFPQVRFAGLFDDVLAYVDFAKFKNASEADFYRRFRQSGGHVKLIVPDSVHNLNKCSQSQREQIVILGECEECLSFLSSMSECFSPDEFVVFGAQGHDWPFQNFTELGYEENLRIDLVCGDVAEAFHLYSRQNSNREFVEKKLVDLQALKMHLSIDDEFNAFDVKTPVIRGQVRPVAPIVLRPEILIMDGSRSSESDGEYGWLWIGRERHLRILLGAMQNEYRSIRVNVPKAFSDSNLAGTKLLINGEAIPTSLDPWGEGAGAITAKLPSNRSKELVLGIAVPFCQLSDSGDAWLSAIVDRIELLP